MRILSPLLSRARPSSRRRSALAWLCMAPALVAAAPAGAAVIHGLSGEFWDQSSFIPNAAAAEAIADSETPDVVFRATTLSFPNGEEDLANTSSLRDYFGPNAEDYAGAEIAELSYSVWRLTGWFDLDVGTYAMQVGTDDGFVLYLDGQEAASHPESRAFGYTGFTFEVTDVNPVAVTLVWFENNGLTGMEFLSDGLVLGGSDLLLNAEDDPDLAAVPLPASGVLLGAALLGLRHTARRGRRAV
ncbi:VPLPA-CTERM protein sorting domain-containing protein [Albimonas donghaensis]|uniref:VPLPA-CTERM protein sorting domain-containing protein n=1 Tax=Albimonas donghaensis TaxID=356660 RepID=A0A1H3D7Q8_9RHOB|nr:hypothetical protein [Albimonas donghaensis]SDX61784.1 VPLPA-CTERM protein sorting domain-containing protein [Albimonas donghaensis]